MKREVSQVCDPGNLSMKELKKQMHNPDGVPFWRMHPLVQHCLRVYQELRPGSVQWKSSDACRWVVNNNGASQMFLERYRLASGRFNQSFIKYSTNAPNWRKRFRS